MSPLQKGDFSNGVPFSKGTALMCNIKAEESPRPIVKGTDSMHRIKSGDQISDFFAFGPIAITIIGKISQADLP